MDYGRAALVVFITLFIVIGVNAAIYVSFTRRKNHSSVGQIEMLQRAARQVRNPWEKEDADLQELSQRVKTLRPKQVDEENESR